MRDKWIIAHSLDKWDEFGTSFLVRAVWIPQIGYKFCFEMHRNDISPYVQRGCKMFFCRIFAPSEDKNSYILWGYLPRQPFDDLAIIQINYAVVKPILYSCALDFIRNINIVETWPITLEVFLSISMICLLFSSYCLLQLIFLAFRISLQEPTLTPKTFSPRIRKSFYLWSKLFTFFILKNVNVLCWHLVAQKRLRSVFSLHLATGLVTFDAPYVRNGTKETCCFRFTGLDLGKEVHKGTWMYLRG